MSSNGASTPPQVTIVVLNWNGHADTAGCLDSLRAVVGERVKVLVVDNGSTDGSVPAIRAAHPGVELIETGANLGYAGGNNVGIARAVADGADFVLVLNNDTTCAPDLVDRLLEAAARHPRAGFLCPRMLYMDDPQRVWFDGARWKGDALTFGFPGKDRPEAELGSGDHDTDYACGAALFVRAQVVREVGLFDERYFLVWEESDWCYRARAAGWTSMVVPAARIWHKVGAAFGSEESPLRTYFSARNKLVWLARHGSAGERLRALAAAVRAALPRWQVSGDTAAPWLKRLLWAARDWARSAAGRGERVNYLARRLALLDFVRGRLGPPPAAVLELNRRWGARRSGQARA
ncbi:MAG: glycosyltransferase family 2 protein [Burkholderiales bacterium]|nr:glycosyltransferase family 2 protein [Burkholderiales bacterium]